MLNHKEQKGYLTFAQNNSDINYLKLAYLQALSIKSTQKINAYAVIVDADTAKLVTEKHRRVFDYVITLDEDAAKDDEWKLANEWKVFHLTPFKETIKLDSDILFTRNIDHWWSILQERNVCCAADVRDYYGNISDSRAYREQFDLNHLPNLYSGFSYFRYSQEASDFFKAAKSVYQNWPLFRDTILKNCRDEKPVTDEVYAISSILTGYECYLPFNGPSFVHMKGAIQGWSKNTDWTKMLYANIDNKLNLTVGGIRQKYPFHYVVKDFCTDEIIEKYEQFLESSRTG